ncbi:mycothiol-dependent maleylpyruvate isomerase NagL [Luedemannella flava]|uniref:Mycothiol-dependent maleylpyruvate isomerase NagL n=1 Tax=Luedemannella flava TaxID=349316 RepID=A0ABP4YMI3_9ACTN
MGRLDTLDQGATLPWMRKGTAVFTDAVARLDDAAFAAPSLLPGWSRAHVIGHVARNAEGLTRLCEWAATGVETPMYASRESRDADIEASAVLRPAALREDLVTTASRLTAALSTLDDTARRATVRGASGLEFPAARIPWLRVREVWLHAVDLAADVSFDDIPAPLVDALIDDVTGSLSKHPDCPPVLLVPLDRGDTVRFGPPGVAPTEVTGTAAQLVGWVSGRAGAPSPTDVILPAWL